MRTWYRPPSHAVCVCVCVCLLSTLFLCHISLARVAQSRASYAFVLVVVYIELKKYWCRWKWIKDKNYCPLFMSFLGAWDAIPSPPLFQFKFYPYTRKLRHPLNTNLFHPLKFYLYLITKILFMFLYRSGYALRKWVAFLFYFYGFL